jgi:predicted transglutaminase-like cysteine proteinase
MPQFLLGILSVAVAAAASPGELTQAVSQLSGGELIRAPRARAPAIFGALAVPANSGRFSERWLRASLDDSSDPRLRALIAPAVNLSTGSKLAYVQSAVTRLIRWRSDATQWGEQDYWASAAETLRSGAGDEEDRAIVKMQALRALGFQPGSLYLTIGKDTVGGRETVLIVRSGEKYYMLEDTGGAPFPTSQRPEFRPIITCGYQGLWIHGYPLAVPGRPSPQ